MSVLLVVIVFPGGSVLAKPPGSEAKNKLWLKKAGNVVTELVISLLTTQQAASGSTSGWQSVSGVLALK